MNGKESLLPDDVIYTILLHLPFKSLFRLRRVSIRWNQIITSRSFSSNLSLKNSVSIIVRSIPHSLNLNIDHRHFVRVYQLCATKTHGHQRFPPIQLHEPAQKISISWSGVDGLLYILGKRDNGNTDITLWNPYTNRCKMVSFPAGYGTVNFVGFSYDESISDYKIVVVYDFISASENVVCGVRITHVNSDGGVWRRPIADVPNLSVQAYVSYSSFDSRRTVDGCHFAAVGEDMYWICMKDGYVGILSFNVKEEKLSLTMPSILKQIYRPNFMTKDSVKLCVYRGCLYICLLGTIERCHDELRVVKRRGGDGGSEEKWEVEKVFQIPVGHICYREVVGFNGEGGLIMNYGDILFTLELWRDSKTILLFSAPLKPWKYQSTHILEMGSFVSP